MENNTEKKLLTNIQIYKTNTKNEAKRLRAMTKWGAILEK